MLTREWMSVITDIPAEEILNIYVYGSEVYGCHTPESDEDYIIVRSGEHETSDIRNGDVDVTIYDVAHFQEKVDAHYIANLECLWLPDHLKLEAHTFTFTLDLSRLRHSISECCSISHVKCRKRLIPTNNYYDPRSAKKSFWHAIRMADFGTQIAKHGKIHTYDSVNVYRHMILDLPDDWEIIKQAFQPVFNQWMTMFREAAPK